MKEREYILSSNRMAITNALDCLYQVVEGHKYGVNKELIQTTRESLFIIQQNLFDCMVVDNDK